VVHSSGTDLLKNMTSFILSPFSDDQSLDNLISCLYVLKDSGLEIFRTEYLVKNFLDCVESDVSRAGMHAAAAVTSALLGEDALRCVEFYQSVISSGSISQRQLALLTIGEIGRRSTLDVFHQVFDFIIPLFSDSTLEIRSCAAFAIGHITFNQIDSLLPKLVLLMESSSDKQLLFSIVALKDVLSLCSYSQLSKFAAPMCSFLYKKFEHPDDDIRQVAAECVGMITGFDEPTGFASLEPKLSDPNPLVRICAASALKHAISKRSVVFWKEKMSLFLPLLDDKDLAVKQHAFYVLNSICYHLIDVMLPYIAEIILPKIYACTSVNPDYIREVNLGPFQVKVDDGLPLRSSAFACMSTILDMAPHRVDLAELIRYVSIGFNDVDEIQALTYNILYKLASSHSSSLLENLDMIPDRIMQSLKAQIKATRGSEPESARNVLRSAVRALVQVRKIPKSEESSKFEYLYTRVIKTSTLSHILKEFEEHAPRSAP